MDKYIMIQSHSYTTQGRFICRSLLVVGTSSFFGTRPQCGWAAFLAASTSVASTSVQPVNMETYFLFDPNSFLYHSGKLYLQECCGGLCIFIVWHSTTMSQAGLFGCSSQCA